MSRRYCNSRGRYGSCRLALRRVGSSFVPFLMGGEDRPVPLATFCVCLQRTQSPMSGHLCMSGGWRSGPPSRRHRPASPWMVRRGGRLRERQRSGQVLPLLIRKDSAGCGSRLVLIRAGPGTALTMSRGCLRDTAEGPHGGLGFRRFSPEVRHEVRSCLGAALERDGGSPGGALQVFSRWSPAEGTRFVSLWDEWTALVGSPLWRPMSRR
jgi:hypothetical protein